MAIIPFVIPNVKENIYSGFWPRFCAGFMDGIICFPVTYVIGFIDGFSEYSFCFSFVLNLSFCIYYEVYLVKRYGGTLGKQFFGLKIISKEGKNVGWKESFLRYSVNILIYVLSFVFTFTTVLGISDEQFFNMEFLKRSDSIFDLGSNWWVDVLVIWVLSEFIVLLTNKRKRAVHDFIAGTVVIKSIYHNEILKYKTEEGNALL